MQKIRGLLQSRETPQYAHFAGWVRSIRKSKKFAFIIINDGSSFNDIQIVVDASLSNYEEVTNCLTGSSFEIEGKLVASQGKGQKVEVQAEKIKILGKVDESYPIQKKETTLEMLREIAHLRPRTKTFQAIFRVRNCVSFAIHEFFQSQNFLYVHSPLITANDGEGAGEMFTVTTLDGKAERKYEEDFFNQQVFLTVTGQLEAEAFACSNGSVYTFGPTFRAENSNTPRHLAEFWMIEPEVAFCDLEGLAKLSEDFLKFVFVRVLERCRNEIEFLGERNGVNLEERMSALLKTKFKRMTYTDAIDDLEKSGKKFENSVSWGIDLQTEHERYLTEEKYLAPIIVTDYPKGIKAFYMKQNADGKTVRGMDVLVPGVGEIIGGSQREDSYELLLANMKEKNVPTEHLEWYLDLRKYGSVPHSGFGLGLERLVMYVTGTKNIRDVVPFFRTPGNCEY